MDTKDHNQWKWQPLLTKEEESNPYLTLFQLFDWDSLPGLQKKLWQLVKAAITGRYKDLSSKEQYYIVSLYEKLEKLLEASYLIYEQRVREQIIDEAAFATRLHKQFIIEKGEAILVPVLQKMVAITTAELIFFISVHKDATNQQPHYALLVIVPDLNEPSQNKYPETIQAACIELALVSTIIITERKFNQLLQDGHIFYSVIATYENLLYSAKTEVVQISHVPVADIIHKAREAFMNSFGKATAFLEGSRHYYQQNENELSAFLLHQAVKLCYLSLLITFINYEDQNHDLYNLRRSSRVITEELNQVFILANEKESNLFSLLQDAYLDARYNSSFKVTDEDLKWLINQVAILVNTTLKVFEQYITSFENHFGVGSEKKD